MVDRTPHDLSHLTFQAGKIGRLNTATFTPVLPGDGFQLDLVGAVRLSPLRRGLTVDSVVDFVTCYIPYRHIYGDDWVDFIEQGYDETVSLATESAPSADLIGCMGLNSFKLGGSLPKWIPQGYRNFWNRYCRPPTTIAERNDAVSSWSEEEIEYGLRMGELKNMWTALLANNIDASDYEVASGTNVSLLALDQQRAYLRTEQEREFFDVRYADIMKSAGGYTNYNVDERPHILMRSTLWASGYDVDGTDQVSLGQHVGRVVQQFRHRVPRFHVPEHGTIWTFCWVRFPVIHEEEQHFLVNNPNPTYAQISGDPEIVAAEPPYGLTRADVFSDTSSSTIEGYIPFGQWYRYHPNLVNPIFDKRNGFPFQNSIPADTEEMVLCDPDNYDDIFESQVLGHYNLAARANQTVMRRLPSARASLMAGS